MNGTVSLRLRRLVIQRAHGICEYCLIHQTVCSCVKPSSKPDVTLQSKPWLISANERFEDPSYWHPSLASVQKSEELRIFTGGRRGNEGAARCFILNSSKGFKVSANGPIVNPSN